MQRAVELHVGGQRYRVVSSASPEDLERLARVVDDKIASLVPPGRPLTPQAILLAAMALAHDLEEERRRTADVAQDARSAVARLLGRVDDAIASVDASVGPARPLDRAVERTVDRAVERTVDRALDRVPELTRSVHRGTDPDETSDG